MRPKVGDIWAYGSHHEHYLLLDEKEPGLFTCLELSTGQHNSYWVNVPAHWRLVA